MSLDVVDSKADTVPNGSNDSDARITRAYWDDALGGCVIAFADGGGLYNENQYGILQLDGSYSRRSDVYAYALLPEIGNPGVAWWDVNNTTGLQPADLRTGGKALAGSFDANLIGLVIPDDMAPTYVGAVVSPVCILPDRVLVVINFNGVTPPLGYFVLSNELWIASIPRSTAVPQVITFEYLLHGLRDYFTGPLRACSSDDPNCVWIGTFDRAGCLPDTDGYTTQELVKYNFVEKKLDTTASITVPRRQTSPEDNGIVGFGWSKAFSTFFAFTPNEVYSVEPVEVPYAVSAPELLNDAGPLKVVGITATNPALITVDRSISAWQRAAGVQATDRIFIPHDDMFAGIKRVDPANEGSYYYHPALAISGKSWAYTVVDDRTISIAADGAAALSEFRNSAWGNAATLGGQTTASNVQVDHLLNPDYNLPDGLQVVFSNYAPANHPINGVQTALETRNFFYNDPTYLPLQAVYANMDVSAWTDMPDPLSGHFTPRTDLGPVPTLHGTVEKANARAGIVQIDYSGPNPVYTVDSPTWLDDLGIVTTGMIQVRGYRVGFAPPWGYNVATYSAVATRVAPNKFSYALDSNLLGYSLNINSISIGTQAIVEFYNWRYFDVGDKVKLTDADSMPALVGTVFTILEVITPGSVFRTDLDTSAYSTPHPYGALGKILDNMYDTWGEATALDYVALLPTDDARSVRVRVTGSRGVPCPDRAVSWSATDSLAAPAGSFKEAITMTDADGYAYALYYPPVGASGEYTITASVETP